MKLIRDFSPLFLLAFSSLSSLFLLSYSSLSPLFLLSFSSLSPLFLLSFSSLSPLFLLSFLPFSCDKCGGKGKVSKSVCSKCRGTKVQQGEQLLTLFIEKGMPEGYEIKSA